MTITKSNMITKYRIDILQRITLLAQSGASRVAKLSVRALLALVLTLTVGLSGHAQSSSLLTESYPDRYTVVEGDTLWDISGKFLRDPWRWPEVWQGNPQVENPDLIFPGDVLVMTFVNGRPVLKALRRETVKLSPSARATRYENAIPLIDPAAIAPYLDSPLVTDKKELSKAPYVVDGFNNRLIMGKGDQFYARNIEDDTVERFRIFKPGRHFVDPVTKESLGWEANHLGNARMMKGGDPARLEITTAHEDINIRNRLRPVLVEEALPFFAPTPPSNEAVRGVILDTPNKSAELGALSIIAINLGEREQIKSGNVLRVKSQKIAKKDPLTGEKYFIPEEEIGLALVFRTFEKVSYAIITNSNRQVTPGDVLVSPYAE